MDPPKPPPVNKSAAGRSLLGYLISMDTALSYKLHSLTQPLFPSFLFLILELSADFRLFFPISLSLLLSPTLLRPFLPPLLLGLLLDLLVLCLIKLTFRRSRPLYNHTHSMNVAVPADHFSFPSGHASRVCFVASLAHLSAATIRQAMAPEDEGKALNFVLLAVWVWAVVTSVSRVLLGRHFVSDVFFGACVGVLEALFAFHFLRF